MGALTATQICGQCKNIMESWCVPPIVGDVFLRSAHSGRHFTDAEGCRYHTDSGLLWANRSFKSESLAHVGSPSQNSPSHSNSGAVSVQQ